MVRTNENGLNVAPFLIKCYEMVDDESTDTVISWSQSNDTFIIWDITDFSLDLLPKYFKHQNFSSFMRQLNIYGFRKVDTDRWEFANEGFIKGQRHLLKNIKRRKHPQGIALKNPPQDQLTEVSDEVDYASLLREVEILQTDKNALTQELVKLRERQESSQNKLLVLRERLQGMENNQQQLLSFLVMVMQNPGLLVQLLQPKERSWHIKEYGNDATSSDGLIVRYQPLPSGDTPPPLTPLLEKTKKPIEQDLSFDRVKDFFRNFDFPSSPIDEAFLSSENSGSIMLPELDLAKLEEFLMSSPSRDIAADANLDDEDSFGSEIESEFEKCQLKCPSLFEEGTDLSPCLELLTEQMGSLSSLRSS